MTRSVTALNMNSIAFKVAATFAQLNLTKRFTFFPSDQDLKALPEAACLLRAIVEFLQDVPRRHRRTWKKMLVRAFPELENNELDQILAKLVVKSNLTFLNWKIITSKNILTHKKYLAPIAMLNVKMKKK